MSNFSRACYCLGLLTQVAASALLLCGRDQAAAAVKHHTKLCGASPGWRQRAMGTSACRDIWEKGSAPRKQSTTDVAVDTMSSDTSGT